MQIAGQYWTDGVPNPAWTTHGNYFINSLEAVCSDHTAPEPLTPNAGSSSCPTTPAPSNLLPFFWPAFHVQSPAYGWSSFTMSTNGTWAVDLLDDLRLCYSSTKPVSTYSVRQVLTTACAVFVFKCCCLPSRKHAVISLVVKHAFTHVCVRWFVTPACSLADPPAGAVGENCGVSVPLYSAIDYTAMKDAALFPPKASCCPPGVFVEFLSWTVTRVQCNDPNGCNGIAVDGYAGTAASPVPQYTVGLISGQCLDGTVLRTVSRYNVLNGDGPVPTTCPVQYDAIDSDVRSYASSPVQYFVASATSSHVVTSMFSANDTDYPCPDGFALSGFQAASACTGITLLEVFCSPLAPPPLPPPSPPPAVYNGVCSPLLQAVPDRSYTEVSRSCCPEGSFISQLEFAVNPGSDSYQPPAYEGVAAFLSGIQGTCSDGTLLQSIGQMQANGCVNRYDYNYTDYEYDIISGTLEYYSLESTTGWNSFEVNDLETTIGAFGFGDTRYHSDETNFSCSQYGAIFVGYGDALRESQSALSSTYHASSPACAAPTSITAPKPTTFSTSLAPSPQGSDSFVTTDATTPPSTKTNSSCPAQCPISSTPAPFSCFASSSPKAVVATANADTTPTTQSTVTAIATPAQSPLSSAPAPSFPIATASADTTPATQSTDTAITSPARSSLSSAPAPSSPFATASADTPPATQSTDTAIAAPAQSSHSSAPAPSSPKDAVTTGGADATPPSTAPSTSPAEKFVSSAPAASLIVALTSSSLMPVVVYTIPRLCIGCIYNQVNWPLEQS
eukprot:jgi/Chlat1/6582/Chrsp45S05934